MTTTDKPGIDRCIRLLAQYGVRDWVFSPGSRNAPMALAVRSLSEAKIEVVVDERSAGFIALGMALASKRPVVLCCTSGSAAANYLPAVVEAFYAGVSLIVLTADRPEHRVDQFEGQTIRQRGLFGKHVLYEAIIEERPSGESNMAGLERLVFEAFYTSQSGGPVHLNAPVSEPLYGTREVEDLPRPAIARVRVQTALEADSLTECARRLSSAKKILIVLGSFPDRSKRRGDLLEQLLRDPRFYLLSESLSNLDRELGCAHIDRLVLTLDPGERTHLRPDVVLAFGGELVSRKLKLWLKEAGDFEYWQVGTIRPGRVSSPDPMERLSRAIPVDAELFLESILGHPEYIHPESQGDYALLWKASHARRELLSKSFLEKAEWSDLAVHHQILKALPTHAHLFEGNSSPIRYVQLCDPRPDLHHLANRGVSGIEGTTSTALGYARRTEQTVVLLTGDLAFFYDSNAFWHAKLPDNFKIAVINNGGGGIFRIIEGPNDSGWLEEHFEWRNTRSAELHCAMFSVAYFRASSSTELNTVLTDWLNTQGTAVLEIFTPAGRNPEVLDAYFENLRHG